MNSYSEFIEYLNQREKLGIKFGLDNMNYLMEKLKFPQKKMRCIHVAGTNGKGSVCAMLSSVLKEARIKVGLYTSPHLIDVKERIRINERDITEEEILTAAKKVITVCPPETTYFELLTGIAIEFFHEQGVEIAIMETGMGGRLDATNVCFGEIAIITDISLEHTQYLGDTIEKIRQEKMAIVKPGSAVIIAEGGVADIKTNLIGNYQKRNAALALKAIEVLRDKGYNIPQVAVENGLTKVRWPGRFQILSRNPLIILDGAHNPGAALALKEAVNDYVKEKVILIIGVLKDKDYTSMLKILAPIAKRIITVTPKSERALSGDILAKTINAEYIPDVMDALESVRGESPVLVTGSLYLVGEVLHVQGFALHMICAT